jgi:hypothetical protein
MTVEYVVAVFLTAANCGPSCLILPPGQVYKSLSETQNPNWCVVNRGNAPAVVKFEMFPMARMLLGRGVQPCRPPNVPTS